MSTATDLFKKEDLLLLVDIQNDFCSQGSLPVPKGDDIIPVVNRLTRAAEINQTCIFFSRDFHPLNHPSFKRYGGFWPEHCIQDTAGAKFHPDLYIPNGSDFVTKGVRFDQDQTSAFDQTGLEIQLQRQGIKRVWIGGLALEVCVLFTVLDSLDLGYETLLLIQACRAITPEGESHALEKMRSRGAKVVDITE